jgi:pimeloyl-ACP methyl ester carboxylesterase
MLRRLAMTAIVVACGATLWAALSAADPAASAPAASAVTLTPCHVDGVKEELRCGVYKVFENRKTRKGRMLPLKIVLLPARHPHTEQGPIFYMAGGPGEAATELAELVIESGDADEHDVVLVDERGTGEGHRLDCHSPGSDDNLESYLNGPFDPAAARACRDELQKQYDLTQYSTPNFVDDIDEIRGKMGYDKINLSGGSFGTYAELMYIHRHGDRVRSAYLSSLVPLSNRVPLYHAEAAQLALDELFKECDEDAACDAAYPRLREDFATVLKKVREAPVLTSVQHPVTGARTEIHLTERAFGDALRTMMYRSASARQIPFLIGQALAGDFSPFAEAAVRSSRDIYSGGNMGIHYAITCNEFVSRIKPEDVEPATRGSFLGSWRVREQMAACKDWPKTELPPDYFEPFRSDVPAILVSGETDSTASLGKWAKEVASFMTSSIYIVVPGGGHTPDNECERAIRHEFFRTGSTKGLDTTCIAKMQRPPFKLPANVEAKPGS